MALAGHDPQSRLRAEIDQLAAEVTLVLRNALIQRRGQSRIIPCSSLRIMVDKVHTRGIRKTHFPSAGQGSQLGDWLLLDSSVVGAGVLVLTINHTDVLLASWVHPGCRTGVVVDKI